jgi:O-antigen/teichoic acid export membrane protein
MLKKNILANYFGSVWMTILSLLLVPIYISLLGIEAWGLIGLFTTVLSIMSLLDLGFSGAINRELSSLSTSDNTKPQIYNLLKTMEVVYYSLSFIVLFVFTIFSVWELNAGSIHIDLTNYTKMFLIIILGLLISIQLPISLYSGALLGFQDHVLLNKINIILSTIRGLGAVFVLWISPNILNFYYWQLFISILNLIIINYYVKVNLPDYKSKAKFDNYQLNKIWKFALGLSLISILGVVISQTDKLLLGQIVTLKEFGYYMVASSAAASIVRIAGPIYNSVYPKFSELVTLDDQFNLARLYHNFSLLLSFLIFPFAFTACFFSFEIISMWTGNTEIALNSYKSFSILIFGFALNGILHMPYAIQLAHKWTKLLLFKNIFSVLILLPLIYFLSISIGIEGAAYSWLIINLFDLFIVTLLMHRKILVNERLKWFAEDLLVPLFISFTISSISRVIFNHVPSINVTIHLFITLIFSYFIILYFSPATKSMIFSFFKFKILKR